MCTPEMFREKKPRTRFAISAEKWLSNDGGFRSENIISLKDVVSRAALKSMALDYNHTIAFIVINQTHTIIIDL